MLARVDDTKHWPTLIPTLIPKHKSTKQVEV